MGLSPENHRFRFAASVLAVEDGETQMASRISRGLLTLTAAGLVGLAADPLRAQEPVTVLDPITVEGENLRDTRDRIVSRRAVSATGTDTPVIETPQSVSTITRKQIDDQNPQRVGNALRYTSGVLSDADATSRYDSVFLRGFGNFGIATDFVSYLDGLKLPQGQAFGHTQIDPFLLDRIDVLKGPSALLYGQISPGGLVNQISRMPSPDTYNEVRIEAGSHGRVQGGFTSHGALDPDGVWQYGISTVGRYSGSRYDDVKEQRFGIAPALTWQPDADTRLTLHGYYQNDPEGGYFNSLYPAFLAPQAYRPFLNSKLNIGDPAFDSFEREQYGIGYQFEHRFNDHVEIGSSLRYSHVGIDMQSLQMSAPITADGFIPRHALRSIEDARGITLANHAIFSFDTGAASHRVLAGIDHQSSTSDWEYRFGVASPLDVTNPQYGMPVGPLATIIDSEQKLSQIGIYLQDQINLGSWRAILGVRHDWTKQDSLNRLADAGASQSSDETTYRAGLLYLFDSGLAPYASYSTSFEPVIGVGADGTPFVPTRAEQFEAGIKYQPDFLDAQFTVSAFDIRQENVLTPGSVPGFSVQQGEIRSRGLEFEARGNVTDNLELIAAVTLLDTKVTKSNVEPSIVGNRPQAVPDYFGSVWANYTFHAGTLEGLSIGGGVRFVGSSYGDDANTVRSPGYTLVDAALRYDLGAANPAWKGAQATLNVTNLFDKEHYSSCSSNFYCQFGGRRQIVAGLRYTW